MGSNKKSTGPKKIFVRPSAEKRKASKVEEFMGWVTGHLLYRLAVRAADRQDWHEFNHCMAALMGGNSVHRDGECPFPPVATQRPLNLTGVAMYRSPDPEPAPAGGTS